MDDSEETRRNRPENATNRRDYEPPRLEERGRLRFIVNSAGPGSGDGDNLSQL